MTTQIVKEFSTLLNEIVYPKENELKEGWHIEGVLSKCSNMKCKFDVRNMTKHETYDLAKPLFHGAKADKVVFKTDQGWVVFDYEELMDYFQSNKKGHIDINELINNLSFSWYIKNEL
jgi:hypothetical protein